mgnify:CR=1 FL=1
MRDHAGAVLIRLGELHPEAGLAPGLDDACRSAFLRWMSFVASAIYAHYWLKDDPSRLVAEATDKAMVMTLARGNALFQNVTDSDVVTQIADAVRFFVGDGTADNPNAGILFGNGYSYTTYEGACAAYYQFRRLETSASV